MNRNNLFQFDALHNLFVDTGCFSSVVTRFIPHGSNLTLSSDVRLPVLDSMAHPRIPVLLLTFRCQALILSNLIVDCTSSILLNSLLFFFFFEIILEKKTKEIIFLFKSRDYVLIGCRRLDSSVFRATGEEARSRIETVPFASPEVSVCGGLHQHCPRLHLHPFLL